MNLIEKILARASGGEQVSAGDVVDAQVDLAMIHDLTGPLTVNAFNEIGAEKVWDHERIVVIFDHLIPANSVQTAQLHKMLRDFVKRQGIQHFYDVGKGGVCHQIMAEKHVRPDQVVVGADSHTCAYGALGAFSTGIGSTEMAAVFVSGRLWFRVPKVIKVQAEGAFRRFVSPKDLILKVIGELGASGATYMGLEFTGSAVRNMIVDGRLTLCNMAIEAGAKAGIVEPDAKTWRYLKEPARRKDQSLASDAEAEYTRTLTIRVDELEPMVACPSSVDNVKPVIKVKDVRPDQVFIGSCTNGRIEDLKAAARILRGKEVHKGVRLIVIPASNDVYLKALEEGLIEIFLRAKAAVENPNCGPCLGGHMGILADDEVCVSTSNRNFIGRMGSPRSKLYLVSPETAAASAVAGSLTNPYYQGR